MTRRILYKLRWVGLEINLAPPHEIINETPPNIYLGYLFSIFSFRKMHGKKKRLYSILNSHLF